MLFNSPVYIFLFLPIVVIVYFTLNRQGLINTGKIWMVLAALFFYGYWNPIYLLLIISSIVVNYGAGHVLGSMDKRRDDQGVMYRRLSILIAGIVFNLGLLGYFKYADFFLKNVNWLAGTKLPMLELALPLAISFFTFQQIAYLVDCYRHYTREHDFLYYCLFVTFFPQLIAGPIVHHRQMMPQFTRRRNKQLNWRHLATGVSVFAVGLYKKVCIADSFSVWVAEGFDTNQVLGFFEAWGTSLSYTFQLYYDFSGYSDMAIGAALLFNIRLPINFDSPYKAVSIQDFWRRWHITLSYWLRDYIYVPLGGNRKGSLRTYANLFTTFLLGGLWHGAAWNFVLWGGMHGVALVIHRAWRQRGLKMPVLLGWFLTFMFVNFSWVFFRAISFEDAGRVIRGMVGLNGLAISKQFINKYETLFSFPFFKHESIQGLSVFSFSTFEYIVIFGLVAFLLPNALQSHRILPYKGRLSMKYNLIHAMFIGALIYLALNVIWFGEGPSEFLYFDF